MQMLVTLVFDCVIFVGEMCILSHIDDGLACALSLECKRESHVIGLKGTGCDLENDVHLLTRSGFENL